MYENPAQGIKTKTRWGRWSSINRASRRFKQRGLYQPITTGNKAALRRCYAIQHVQQRRTVGLMAAHERETGLDLSRAARKSKTGVTSLRTFSGDSKRPQTQQGKLVWPDLVSTRSHQRLGDKRTSLAKGSICAMDFPTADKEASATSKKGKINVLRPYDGHIDPSIGLYDGQIEIPIRPYDSPIRGYFAPFLRPYYGFLLDIPLYIAIAGGKQLWQ